MLTRSVTLAVAVALSTPACASTPSSPPPPSANVPALQQVNPPVLCVGCDEPFDLITHKKLLDSLATNPYVAELRKALYQQDVVHQFESKAHFDNCDFDSATGYITSLLDEANAQVDEAKSSRELGEEEEVVKAAKAAFFAIGQALHAVQDFYAHSNYVEMQAPGAKKVTDIEIVFPWRESGRKKIQDLREKGLYSGYVFWGFPQECPDGTPSHGDLAKDSETTESGSKRLPHLQNISQHKVAVFLAREASLALMAESFRRWPLLKELNGNHVAFEILLDRRDADRPHNDE